MSTPPARRRATCVLLASLLLGVGSARAQEAPGGDAAAALAAVEARAGADPDAALEALDALLRSPALEPRVRRRAEALRPGLLRQVGRADEARAGWEALLRQGEDVAAPLLALAGARLDVEVSAAPGAPAEVHLGGARTGPLVVRLYRVHGARLRAAFEADPARGIQRHLRAPPAAALSRLAEWQADEPPAGARVTTRSPGRLDPGVYLVTVTARGVTVPAPVVVAPALAVTRRRAGPGLLWLVDRATGAPLPNVPVVALDADGAPGATLGATSEAGTLAWTGAPPAALAWLAAPEPLPLVAPLPGPRAAPPPAPPTIRLDLPVHRPGQLVRARVGGLSPGVALEAALLDPRGVAVDSARSAADPAGEAEVALRLPPDGPPGEWQVVAGASRATVRVLPAPVPEVEVDLVLPSAVVSAPGARLAGRVEARLTTGQPLAGRTVRWRVRAHEAAAPFEPEEGPLPPFALRGPVLEGGPLVASGEVVLDARGEGAIDVPVAAPRPLLLRIEAEVALGPAAGGAAPTAVAFVSVGPRDLLLALRPAKHVVAPAESVVVEARGARLDGRAAALVDLELTASLRPAGGGAPRVERRGLRIDADGRARASFMFDAPGEVTFSLSGRDEGGRDVAAVASLLVVAPGVHGPREGAASLRLEAPPAPDAPEVRLLAELPFERGWALVTVEGTADDEAPAGRLIEVTGGRARMAVPVAAREVVLAAVHAGVVHEARAEVDAPEEPLAVAARPEPTGLRVQVSGADGKGRLAGARAWSYPAATAALLARVGPATRADDVDDDATTRARSSGTVTPLAWPALECRDAQAAWTNGLGIGGLRTSTGADGVAWTRVEAVDRRGRRGAAWCRLDPPPAPLAVRLVGPTHAVDGDRGELAARIAVSDLAALPEAAVLRVTWSGEGVEVKTPRAEGTRPVLMGDAGPAALRLEPARAARVVLPVVVAAGGPGRGPDPTTARVSVRVEVEGTPLAAAAEWTARVRPRGRVERATFVAEVPADGSVQRALDLPPQAIAGTARLELAVDPDATTAVVAAAGALARSDDPLLGPPHALLARRRVEALLAARRLAPPAAAWPAAPASLRLDRVLGALAATRDEHGAWGARTRDVVRALLELRAAGVDIPDALLEPALAWLARRADLATDGRAALALALAGRLAPDLAATLDPPAAPPDERPALARALHLSGGGRRAEEAVAAAVVGARALTRAEARADLLALLIERGEAPALQAELVAALLDARAGHGWEHPADAGAAVGALALVAARETDGPGMRVEATLEGVAVLEAWSGAALVEWTGPTTVDGSRVARRARLELKAQGPRPARAAGRVVTLVRDAAPVTRGARVARRIEVLRRDGPAPLGVRGVAPGDLLRVVVEVAPAEGEGGAPLDDLVLEVPLPGGCALAESPPGGRVADGVWVVSPSAPRAELLLVAVHPGEFRVQRARARGLRAPDRAGTSDEVLLRVQ